MNAEQKSHDGGVWFIAEAMPDWTTVQFDSGRAIAFNRETGRVYQLPHPDCPFVIIPAPCDTRALQQRPSEDEVEAAARRMLAAQQAMLPEAVPLELHELENIFQEDYRRMARAALGVE